MAAFFPQRHSILASSGPARVARIRGPAVGDALRSHAPGAARCLRGIAAAWALQGGEGGPQRRAASRRAHITQGRGRRCAQGVLLLHAGLCTWSMSGGRLPIFGHTVGGNENGHTAVAEQLALLRKHLRSRTDDDLRPGHVLGGAPAAVGMHVINDRSYALCAAPWWSFASCSTKHAAAEVEAGQLFVDRNSNGAAPWATIAAGALRLGGGAAHVDGRGHQTDVPCRVIFVFSTADQKVAARTREKSTNCGRDWSRSNRAWPPATARRTNAASPAAWRGSSAASRRPSISIGKWCR